MFMKTIHLHKMGHCMCGQGCDKAQNMHTQYIIYCDVTRTVLRLINPASGFSNMQLSLKMRPFSNMNLMCVDYKLKAYYPKFH